MVIKQWGTFTTLENILETTLPKQNFPISFNKTCLIVLHSIYNTDNSIYHDLDLQPHEVTKNDVIFFVQLFQGDPNQDITKTILKYIALGI